MKVETNQPNSFTKGITIQLLVCCLAVVWPTAIRAQIVNDGEINIMDGGTTNFVGELTIGSGGSFTSLTLTNSAMLSCSNGYIGFDQTANSNTVNVNGTGSTWRSARGFFIGYSGAFNRLVISDGGVVSNSGAFLGYNASSSNNRVLVTGVGSLWTNSFAFYVGLRGSGNQLVISNGATVIGPISYLGGSSLTTASNVALVTDAGSVWRNSGLIVGGPNSGGFNQLVVTNGGAVMNSAGCTIGSLSPGNSVFVTGAGSLFSNPQGLAVGSYSNANQLVISDGAVATANTTYVDYQGGSSWNKLQVTGDGSLFTNQNDFYIGASGSSNQLFVADGGTVMDDIGAIGFAAQQKGNTAIVSGGLWTNGSKFYLGYSSPSCQLLVTNGGKVAVGGNSYVGCDASSSNNLVVVSGTSGLLPAAVPSLWTNQSDLYFGSNGCCNVMIITNGGIVANYYAYVGYGMTSFSNKVYVTGTGSLWQTRADLNFGFKGKGNQLIVSDAGTVKANNLIIGGALNTSNQVIVADGTIITGFDTRINYGSLTLNAGTIHTSTLQLGADGQSKFVHNGGKLQTGYTTGIDTLFAIGNGSNAAVFEMLNISAASHGFPGGLLISSNATLTGVGLIVGNVTNSNGGTISPGSGIGNIKIRGNLTLNPGSTTLMELDAASGACDKFIGITSTIGITNLSYGGTLQLTNLAGTFTNGSAFPLFSAMNYTGAFDNITPASPGPGLRWNTNGLAVDGILRVVATPTHSPAISGASSLPDKLVISATGGAAYDSCVLLTSTNLATPVSNWTPWATNTFGASGTAAFTNTILPDEPGRYFRLQVK